MNQPEGSETRIALLSTIPDRRFYYLRHGTTDWNAARKLQGQIDVPMNGEGYRDAERAAAVLADLHLDAIVSSPLGRARETARIVAERHNCPVEYRGNLMERNFGRLTGRLIDDVHREYAITNEHDLHHLEPEEGETFVQMVERFATVVRQILAEYGGDVLFVSHGGMYRSFMWLLTGYPTVCRNGVPYVFERTGSGEMPREVA